ncbi:hypothetical protein BN938_2574 [Mucinivorans hirudinis]|uniref:Uncharacterized protein n=1 Tax=Mucinivorans hirudinis TaxID=1433126 RepID=A0A060REF5_9BACT|nr:hypothetical protein BN938_2574 [Mucinivorans hirudinis]
MRDLIEDEDLKLIKRFIAWFAMIPLIRMTILLYDRNPKKMPAIYWA